MSITQRGCSSATGAQVSAVRGGWPVWSPSSAMRPDQAITVCGRKGSWSKIARIMPNWVRWVNACLCS